MKDLLKALSDAKAEFGVIEKDATATTKRFSYQYLTLDRLIEQTTPILTRHGLIIVQLAEGTSLITHLFHVETGQSLTSTFDYSAIPAEGMQDIGSHITYARRYALGALLGIVTEQDDDANRPSRSLGASTRPNRPVKPRPSQARPAPKKPGDNGAPKPGPDPEKTPATDAKIEEIMFLIGHAEFSLEEQDNTIATIEKGVSEAEAQRYIAGLQKTLKERKEYATKVAAKKAK